MKRFCLCLALFSVLSFAREVPVRYLTVDDSMEREALFVKLVRDTVYLRDYTPEEIAAKRAAAIAKAEEQAIIKKYADIDEDSVDNKKSSQLLEPVLEPEIIEDAVEEERVKEKTAADDFESAVLSQESAQTGTVKADSLKADSLVEKAKPEQSYILLFKYDFKRLINLESRKMVDLTLSDFEYSDEEEEEEIPIYPEGKANLLVKTIPEGCSLYVNGVSLDMLSPDTIRNIKPGKYNISIVKQLKDVDWWGNKAVKINADSLNVIEISVERPRTRLTVNTVPEAVEVYLDQSPNENIMPHYMSDVVIDKMSPKTELMLYFRKVGYLDTAIITEVRAFMPNTVLVELEPVTMNLGIIDMQKEYNRERTKRFIGRGLLWSSIVPFISAGILWYLAESDWTVASEKKDAYEGGSAFYNEDTRKLIEDSKKYNKRGDTKGIVGGSLGLLGIGLATVGFVFAF